MLAMRRGEVECRLNFVANPRSMRALFASFEKPTAFRSPFDCTALADGEASRQRPETRSTMACFAVTSPPTGSPKVTGRLRYRHGSSEQLSSHIPCQHTLDGARYAVLDLPTWLQSSLLPVRARAGGTSWTVASVPRSNPRCMFWGTAGREGPSPGGQVVNGISANVNAAMLLSGRGSLWSMIVPFWWRLGNRRELGILGASSVLARGATPGWHPSRLGISAQGGSRTV